MSCECSPNNHSCNPCGVCDPTALLPESLPSALDNFVYHFFGTVEKTIVDGSVQWNLPCNLDTGFENNPRTDGEGLACYFLRLFDEGITGYTGPVGPRGHNGTDGLSGFTATTEPFVVSENPVIKVQHPFLVPVGSYIFVNEAGWFQVDGKVGDEIYLTRRESAPAVANPVPLGTLVLITGPRGPQGATGPRGLQGLQGPNGPMGSTGLTGAAGESSVTYTTQSYNQPAVGSSVTIGVQSVTWLRVSQQVYIEGAGYYEVVSISAPNITIRNLGGPSAASPATLLSTNRRLTIVGQGALAPSSSTIGDGADYELTNSMADVTFGAVQVHASLPMPGTYLLTFHVQVQGSATPSASSEFQLWNQTDSAALAGTVRNISHTVANSYATATIQILFTTTNAATEIRLQGSTVTTTEADVIAVQTTSSWVRLSPIN